MYLFFCQPKFLELFGLLVHFHDANICRRNQQSFYLWQWPHFTSIIFPNGTVVEIPGIVNGLPGADKQKVKDDGEGTIEQAGDKGRNAGKVAEIAIPTGGTVGSIGGLAGGHPIAGGLAGIGAGIAAAGLGRHHQ